MSLNRDCTVLKSGLGPTLMHATVSCGLLICTLISKINMDFFSVCHLDFFQVYGINLAFFLGGDLEKNLGLQDLKFFLMFEEDLDFQKLRCRLKGRSSNTTLIVIFDFLGTTTSSTGNIFVHMFLSVYSTFSNWLLYRNMNIFSLLQLSLLHNIFNSWDTLKKSNCKKNLSWYSSSL